MNHHRIAFAVQNSENSKTGPMSATYASQRSCPPTCPFLKNGCYCEEHYCGIQTRHLNSTPATPLEIARAEAKAIDGLRARGQDLRLHVVGDCRTRKSVRLVANAARQFTARGGGQVYGYTHAWRTIPIELWRGISMLASCETVGQVINAHHSGYPAELTVTDFDGPETEELIAYGRSAIPCPQQLRNVPCVNCRLCIRANRLPRVILLKAHGSRVKKIKNALLSAT